MVDLIWEHSDEDKHEEKGCNRKEEHKDALHKASHHMLSLVVDFFNFCVCSFDVFALQIAYFFNDCLVLFELFLEALRELLHSLNHLDHIGFELSLLCSLLLFIFVKVDNSTPFLRLFLLLVLLLQF